MSNSKRRAERKREIEGLRKAGMAAYHMGASVHSNPYRGKFDMDESHWRDGWQQAQYQDELDKAQAITSKREQLADFAQQRINDLPEDETQYAMQALLDLIHHVMEERE